MPLTHPAEDFALERSNVCVQSSDQVYTELLTAGNTSTQEPSFLKTVSRLGVFPVAYEQLLRLDMRKLINLNCWVE